MLAVGQALCFLILVLILGRFLKLDLWCWGFLIVFASWSPQQPNCTFYPWRFSGDSCNSLTLALEEIYSVLLQYYWPKRFSCLSSRSRSFLVQEIDLWYLGQVGFSIPSQDAEIFHFCLSSHNGPGDKKICCPFPRCMSFTSCDDPGKIPLYDDRQSLSICASHWAGSLPSSSSAISQGHSMEALYVEFLSECVWIS